MARRPFRPGEVTYTVDSKKYCLGKQYGFGNPSTASCQRCILPNIKEIRDGSRGRTKIQSDNEGCEESLVLLPRFSMTNGAISSAGLTPNIWQ